MKYHFNDETIKVLTKGGWYPDRHIERLAIENKIKENDFLYFDAVVELLCEFDGLYFNFYRKKIKELDDFNFDFNKAAEILVPERLIEDYIPRVGFPLCVIGTAYREYFILMLSSEGKIYGAYDSFLCLMGNSLSEALNAIVEDYDFTEIP